MGETGPTRHSVFGLPENDAGYFAARGAYQDAYAAYTRGDERGARRSTERAVGSLGADTLGNATVARATLVRELGALAVSLGMDEDRAQARRWAQLMMLVAEAHRGTPDPIFSQELLQGPRLKPDDFEDLAVVLERDGYDTEELKETLLEPTVSDPNTENRAFDEPLPEQHDPLVAAIRRAIAEAVRFLEEGDIDSARASLDRAEAERAKAGSDAAQRLFEERLAEAKIALALGHLDAAERLLEEALAIALQRDGEDTSDAWRVRTDLAGVAKARGDFERARDQDERVYASKKKTLRPGDPAVWSSGDDVVASRDAADVPDAAQDLEREIGDQRRRDSAPGDRDRIDRDIDDGERRLSQGDPGGAARIFRSVYARDTQSRPAGDPQRRRAGLGLADALAIQGDFNGSDAVLDGLSSEGPSGEWVDDRDEMDLSWRKARNSAGRGDLAGARDLLQRDLEEHLRDQPADHPDIQRTRAELARLEKELGDFDAARGHQQDACDAYERTLPADHPTRLDAVADLAEIVALQEGEAAALELLERELGSGPAGSGDERAARAAQLARECRLEEALALRRELLEDARRELEPGDPALAEAAREVAALLRVLGRGLEARALERELCDGPLAPGTGGPRDPRDLAAALDAVRRASEALSYPPELSVESTRPMGDGRFELRVEAFDPTGVEALRVQQDGRAILVGPGGAPWELDELGTRARLTLELALAPDRMVSLVSITAENPRALRAEELLTVVSGLPR